MALVCGVSCGGCGAGQRDDARGLMLVPPLGRCMAHVGGVCQATPPWFGSWIVPLPAPWCAYWRGAGALVRGWVIVIRWAAVQFVLRVRRHEVGTHEAHRWIVRFDRCPHDLL